MLIEVADNVYGKGSIDYDRKVTVSSISKFLEEPFADLPWNEDTKLKDVLFVENKEKFGKLIKKKLPTLVLFYAPWCGHCKNIRPIYGEVASDRKGETILAAVDMNTAKGKIIGEKYHITGFPTLYYFDKGEDLYPYGGSRTKNDIIAWLQNPTSNVKSDGSPKDTKKGVSVWAENVFTSVEHLTEKTFEHYIKKNNKVLIVFHANWCKHSQNLQPIIEKVAEQMKGESMKIVAVDGAAHNTIVKKYKVDGYPKLYFFENGKKAYEVFARKVHDIIFWAKNPKKPQLPEKSWDLKNTNVVVLNKENFDDTMDLTRHAFIVFYAPWCEHCKHMKSEYVKFADMTKDKKDLCRRQLVGAYPQLRYYFNGEHKEDFRKERSAKEMHAFFWMKIREYDEKEAEKNGKSSKSKPGKDEL
ncbi:hypothetical protein WR25_18797 [Diploscapter pachys]|uniref:Thioredoxin domain-containing protein n=1 Tax=Diploscapter pachys TaxID=2018661 RepID=A0A2A2J8P9_9BILA|nr:hypothetical protein WR25_18797 [Diploscapter pachys]